MSSFIYRMKLVNIYKSQIINEEIHYFSGQSRSGCNMYQVVLFSIDPGIGKKKTFFSPIQMILDIKILSGSRNWENTKRLCSTPTPPKVCFNPAQAEDWRKYLSNLEARFQRSSGLPRCILPFLLLLLSSSSLPPSLQGLVSSCRSFKTQDRLMQYNFQKCGVFSEDILSCRRDMGPWRWNSG